MGRVLPSWAEGSSLSLGEAPKLEIAMIILLITFVDGKMVWGSRVAFDTRVI